MPSSSPGAATFDRPPSLRVSIRGLAGLVLGLAVWWVGAPHYIPLIAGPSGSLMRVIGRPPGVQLQTTLGGEVVVSDAERKGSPLFVVPARYLTLNVALFVVLLAVFGPRAALWRYLAGLSALWLGHIAGLIITVQSLFANSLGRWSHEHYGSLERDIWLAAAQFYRMLGMYALAFAVAWLIAGGNVAGSDVRADRKGRKKKRR